MADEEYNRKLESLQQYIPFLNNMITQLKDPRKKNREQQLAKMVSLHSMITDKKKKLKLETLTKCEDVILKLYEKVKSGSNTQPPLTRPLPTTAAPITPSSPSPPRDIPKTKPVVIPTEKIPDVDRTERDSKLSQPVYKNHVDIYSSAADSLKMPSQKPTVFERLGKKGPDMSKPPISLEDLEALQREVITERLSLNELTDLREKLQRQLNTDDRGDRKLPINTTVRNTTILTKKAVEKEKTKPEIKPVAKSSTASTKPVKVIKEASSIFGNTLSSIDNQILEGGKIKEKERRNSGGSKKEESDKSKERRNSRDEKKADRKDKTEKKVEATKDGEHKKDGDSRERSEKKDHKKGESPKKEQSPKKAHDKNEENREKPKPDETKPAEPPPVYKRLADKYNPKPRKQTLIEIPLCDTKNKSENNELISPTKPQIAAPLLSPTSSTSTDNEVAAFNRKSLLPTPPPTSTTPIPNHVNMLSNPGPSGVVSQQFKGRQTPNHPQPTFPNEMNVRFNQPTNFWPNQNQSHQQPRPQHYSQRSFTPNQYDMDYYPPGNPPAHNPYSNQPPPLLSPHYEGYDRDRDARFREDWRRPPSCTPQRSREPNRDPRLHRDPRNYRDDPRMTPRRDSRDGERSSFRDPRLNRKYERERDAPRSRSVSRESEDTFASPLDSLYSGSEGRKTGKGYGVQNFKIPKIKKESDGENERESETEAKDEKKEPTKDVEKETKLEEKVTKVAEKETKVTEKEEKVTSEPEVKEDEAVASTSVSSSTECEEKTDDRQEAKESADIGEISSTNDIQENQTRDEPKPLDVESQTDIINRFLKKLLENERTRAAASLFIDNVSSSLDDEKLKMVVQTVKSASKEEEKPPLIRRKKKVIKKMTKLGAKLAAKRKLALRRKLNFRKKKTVRVIKDDDDDDEDDAEEEEEEEEEEKDKDKEEVVVSVGERIKSRKRLASTGAPKRKKNKHKTELDLLHEDIQDMFIRDGVLTATGKRMCRLLKNDETKPPAVTEPRRRTRNSTEKFDSEKLKAMSNVRVLIPKISMDKLEEIDDDTQRYSLRRTKSGKSYAEVDSDDEKRKQDKKISEEKEKKVSSEESDEETVQEKERSVSPKKVRKRSKSWASGIIPKRKKKAPEENEKLEFAEPDKNYFSSKLWHSRTSCKLCDYQGMNITRHYRIEHPDSEVLSARLSPDKAEEAIKKSLSLKLDDRENMNLCSTKRYQFICRFCDLEMHSQPSNFYDHISTHTGEYRHICKMCDFSACGNKALKLHYTKSHNVDKYDKPATVKTKIYGYICVECNFVQMTRKTVENHVNVYHLGEGQRILRIHLSVNEDDAPEDEIEDESEKEEPKPKRKKLIEKTESKKMKTDSSKPVKVSPEEENTLKPPPLKKTVPEEEKPVKASSRTKALPKVEKTVELPIVKKEKEIDMTVFTCNTNMQEENEKIEQDRLRKMTELNDSVKTNRQSLNFVDQLSNRLFERALTPEVVTVKSEPDDFLPETDEPPLEVTPKKLSKLMEPPVTSLPVVQKDNTIIQGMIQKLQDILKEEQTLDGPPPLVPLEKVEDVKAFISAGFLNISKSANGLEYACRVPSCLYTSTNRDSFLNHWEEDHTRINQSYKATKCRICSQEVTATQNGSLLSNFFAHVENEHLCGIKTSFNAGLIGIDKECDCLVYMCCVNFCLFNTKDRDDFIDHFAEHSIDSLPKTTKCGICQVVVTPTPDSNILKTLFKHVESKHLEDKFLGKVLRTRRLSGDKLSTTKEDFPEFPEEDENPFPFKISGVMSLAEETVPPLSPIQASPKIESVVLKESKMNTLEKAAIWKCPEAIKKFLQCPRELYKCPQFFCKYATNWRHLFETHIKAHARVKDELVSCVYCDMKTPLSHSGLHIDLRHSNCLYSCSQCLYRALTREYVLIHNRIKHKENDLIIALPKMTKTIMMTKPKQFTVKEACQPYRCGCDAEFLFLNEFCGHLQSCHDGFMSCGFVSQQKCSFQCLVAENMIDHWRSHGCYHFHCLICKMGCMEMYTMLEHYSSTHPCMEPMVVDRRAAPKNLNGTVYGYTIEAFGRIRHVKEELLESVNVQQFPLLPPETSQYVLSEPKCDPSSSETTKNVTLVPLSIFQPNSNEPKKIIAIIPKKGDPIATQLFNESTPFVFASTSEESKDKVESKEDSVVEDGDNSADNNGDPLSLDGEVGNVVSASGDESDSQELIDSANMKSFGFVGYQLFRCAFCDISFSNSRDFKVHTMHSNQCRDPVNVSKPYKCVHCERLFKHPHGLLEHIQYHGPLRFWCSLCVKKFPSSFSLKVHMRNKHNVTNTVTTPLIPNKTNLERDEFIFRPAQTLDPEKKEGPTVSNVTGHKSVYGPDELDQLPKRYIFNSNVRCALCSYSTKVRTNLVRHLQFHSSEKSVPDIAPVNPVPCLDKNERMFDKMTNLALSSMTGASRMGGVKTEAKDVKEEYQVPAYVPSHRRYVCCAGCNYLCLEEANLRHHLYALHVEEPSFTCSHCKMTLKTDVDAFLKHLKLHDLHLYKCSACSFVHNLRHKVDKHASDKHDQATTITVRSMEAELTEVEQPPTVDIPQPSNIKFTKPWHCGMCKYRCAAKSDIISHIFNKHDINAQFKCTLCSYKSDERSTFARHFKENHPDNDIDIINVYYKSEGAGHGASQKQFDTTPLWQRDRPRVRHIRGILFEETSPQKKKGVAGRSVTTTATTATTTTTTPASNLDLAIDAVAKGIDEATKTKVSKENKEETVIIIEDEDVEETRKADESGDNELLIDMDTGEDAQVKSEEAEFLTEEILINKYGKLCGPGPKGFKCPVCLKFKNKKVSSFIHHVLTELKCNRFKCNSCDFASVTFDYFASHCKEKHDSVLTPNVKDTPIEKSLEYWLQLLITHQSKELTKVTHTPTGEDSSSATSKSQCEYCQKWFKNLHLLKDHELVHWAAPTYACSHCCSEFTSLNEIFQHTLITHPMYEVSFATNGPYVGKIISNLKTPQQTAPVAVGANEDTQYSCSYCTEVERSVEALRKHISDCHDGEEFAYKVVTKSKIEAIYCCTYCHERGTDKFLREHQKDKHPGLKFNIYQYICLECSETYLNIKDLRVHFTKVHTGKKLTYSCIESKQGGSKDQYCCTKCPFRSSTLGGIRSHLRKHLRPIDCLTCGATFIYPTEARAHHNKEHLHSAEKVEENKEKLTQYEDWVRQIVAAKAKEIVGVKATQPRKMLARKSTGAPFVREYSYYGSKKEESDLKSVSTSIEVNKVTKKVTAEQFSNIFNIFPVVEVSDCERKGEGS